MRRKTALAGRMPLMDLTDTEEAEYTGNGVGEPAATPRPPAPDIQYFASFAR